MFLLIFFLIILNSTNSYGKIQIPIGGIFNENNVEVEIVFRVAINKINADEKLFQLLPSIKRVDNYDSYTMHKIINKFGEEGVAAIFGPNSQLTKGIVESICDNAYIPHLIAHWEPEPLYTKIKEEQCKMTVNLYPDGNILSKALAELIEDYSWKSVTIIYENDDGLMRMKDILQLPIKTVVRQLPEQNDYRILFKEIQKSGEGRIILDCNPDKLLKILRDAREVKMMEEYQSYVITSLNAQTIDFAEIKEWRANITTLKIFNQYDEKLENIVDDMKADFNYIISQEQIRTESILMYDAVHVFVSSIKELILDEINEENPFIIPQINFFDEFIPWKFGEKIMENIKRKLEKGISGEISFNENGHRINFYLDIIELSKTGFKKIGEWFPETGIIYTRAAGEADSIIIETLQNKTVIVVSRLGAPFLMERPTKDGETFEGNARFEGYSIDLIDKISKILKFNYRFELVPDGKYGSYNKETKQWDGLVRHLLDRKADFAICDLTITYERRTAVDFTMPFMTLGISILFAKPTKESPKLFSFLSPLSLEVWLYMATAYLGVSILLLFLSRMAPDDWENPHPCDKNPQEMENVWDIVNCIWLTMGSIMGQGCDILPKAISTRLVAGMWWFFALIMLSSYTANLAAFLTMTRMDVTIESAEDLAKQSKIKYGAVDGGSTLAFFKGSNFSTYQKMWTAMESTRPSVFTKNNDEGVERVAKGKNLYAFLMESTSLEYIVERNCTLTQIGGLLDNKGYGIAMPVNSPYRTAISGAVLKLQEGGQLLGLKSKWWKEMRGGEKCNEDGGSPQEETNELGIANVGGVFVVLSFGCAAGLLIGIMEFLWNVRRIAVHEKITPKEAFKNELAFAMKVWITSKPVRTTTTLDGASTITGNTMKSSKSAQHSETKSYATNIANLS